MTTLRSSWPSRLRQLLSSEGAIGPSVKVDTEPWVTGCGWQNELLQFGIEID
ncbi:hypothetical protein JHK85_041233 [Glycine max]|nr:hypothetical protein JHK85_041233 [Glycine max]